MYNGIFEMDFPEEACIVGFADDISVLVTARFMVDAANVVTGWQSLDITDWRNRQFYESPKIPTQTWRGQF